MAVPSLIYELWLASIVAYRVVGYSRDAGKWSSSSLVRLLVMDSMGWFLIIASMIIINGVTLGTLPIGLRDVVLPILRSFCIICGCHLIIHMCQECSKEDATTIAPRSLRSPRDQPPQPEFKPPSTSIAIVQPVSHMAPRTPPTASVAPSCRYGRRGPSASSGRRVKVLFESKIRHVLDLAQRFVPPPLTPDIESVWDNPVMTLNVGVGTEKNVDTDQEGWANNHIPVPPMPMLLGRDEQVVPPYGLSTPAGEKCDDGYGVIPPSSPWSEGSNSPAKRSFSSRQALSRLVAQAQNGINSPVEVRQINREADDLESAENSPIAFAPNASWNPYPRVEEWSN
ncbi:hypothetical protein FRB94_013842 [Tulasnella sp. JGI-2019a]|nr:hypothetical protein FRB94_013842 [Tulasnella sp. JGI-2019a]